MFETDGLRGVSVGTAGLNDLCSLCRDAPEWRSPVSATGFLLLFCFSVPVHPDVLMTLTALVWFHLYRCVLDSGVELRASCRL